MKKLTSAEVLNRRFGVEVEMYHITRKNAAITARDILIRETGEVYTVNYVPMEGYDKYVIFPVGAGRSLTTCWSIVSDSSIRADCNHEQTELNSPLIGWSMMPTLLAIIRGLRVAGARSDAEHSCGIHVHVDTADFNVFQLRNLVNIMSAHEELLTAALKLNRGRTDHWCRPVDPDFLRDLARARPTTMPDLQRVWYRQSGGSPDEHYDPSRYHMLNLHSFFQGKGVEFRLFQFDSYDAGAKPGRRGGMHAGVLKSYIQLCLAMCAYAAAATRTSPTVLHNGNQKYAMRCWLLRLGFIGDEFKTARSIYLRRLDGDCSFRNGRPTNNAAVA